MRIFHFRRNPWVRLQHEEQFIPKNYSEVGVSRGAKLENQIAGNVDLQRIHNACLHMSSAEYSKWLDEQAPYFSPSTYLFDTDDANVLDSLRGKHPELIINKRALNKIRHLNTFLNKASDVLVDEGYFCCHARTSALKRRVILQALPGFLGKMVYASHYVWHRVCAKLGMTRWFYMWVTKGTNRTYSRVELLGRMYRAGFEVIDESFSGGEYCLMGKKIKEPIWDDDPSTGILVKLPRVGYKGNIIGVYKFRTMYSYSEYLQPYMLEYEGLQKGGKFANDYRVNSWGRLLRKSWLDEVPMVINLFKRQMKLVGVRPLSRQYFNMYTPEMQKLRITVKPGLLPPFYYDEKTPETLEEVQASEKRYIEAYHEHPFRTDWRYFWGTIRNILFKHKRSR
ncbi:MAG: sugar transferase [Bacteroidales bacterium]|nr:sugar transferase [Bacteroidales bacterium]